MAVSECCLIKLLSYILFEKYIHILALKMASPANRHCANCIDALSFPIGGRVVTLFTPVLYTPPMTVCPPLSVCLSANISPEIHVRSSRNCLRVLPVVSTPCYLWLGPPLAALRYVMYFRFYGWRHVCT